MRALIGLKKALDEKRRIKMPRFVLTLLEAGVIGGLLGSLLSEFSPFVLFLAGVGGTDLIDGAKRLIGFSKIKVPLK